MRFSLLVVVALLLSACSITVDRDESSSPAGPSASSSPSSSSSPDASEPPITVPDEDPPPCPLIRQGIYAFNVGEPEATVRRFTEAIPLAKQYVEDEPGRTSTLLLEAVEYYAELPPEDYQDALLSSPEFKKYQLVTLGVCRYDGNSRPTDAPSDDAQTT